MRSGCVQKTFQKVGSLSFSFFVLRKTAPLRENRNPRLSVRPSVRPSVTNFTHLPLFIFFWYCPSVSCHADVSYLPLFIYFLRYIIRLMHVNYIFATADKSILLTLMLTLINIIFYPLASSGIVSYTLTHTQTTRDP